MIGLSTTYTEYENTRTNLVPDRNTLAVSATGRYEVMQSLTASLTATGERFNGIRSAEIPSSTTPTVSPELPA